MKSIIKYTLLTALRDWLFMGIFLLVLIAISLSAFLGGTAVVEQGYMSAAYIAGSVRMITIIGLVLFVCFHVRRSFENKEVEMILTKPISRVKFVFSYYAGFAVLAFTLVVPIVAAIYLLATINMIWAKPMGIAFWGLSFYLETLVVTAFAFFASLFLRSAVTSVMLTFGFYFLSRIFGFFLIAMHNPASLTRGTFISTFFEKVLAVIGVFVPRLDMFSKSEWLVYGVAQYEQVVIFLASSLIYIPLLLVMATFDFIKRQF